MKPPKIDTKFAKSGFMALPPWGKAVVVVGSVVLAYVVVRKIGKAISGVKDNQGSRQEDRLWNQVFDDLNTSASTKPTLSKEQMVAYANKIEEAVSGLGTNWGAVESVIKALKNDADYAGLSAAYGRRTVEGPWMWSDDFTGTLSQTLSWDMDSSEINELNEILAKKGIKYRL